MRKVSFPNLIFSQTHVTISQTLCYVTAVAASSTAMQAVINSSTALEAVVNSSTAMQAVAASQTALQAVFASWTAKNAIYGSSIADYELRNSQTAVAYLTSIASEINVTVPMNQSYTMTTKKIILVNLKMYCSSYDYNKRAENFVYLQDGITATTMTVANNTTDNENWPLVNMRIMNGLTTVANSGRNSSYQRIAKVVYLEP